MRNIAETMRDTIVNEGRLSAIKKKTQFGKVVGFSAIFGLCSVNVSGKFVILSGLMFWTIIPADSAHFYASPTFMRSLSLCYQGYATDTHTITHTRAKTHTKHTHRTHTHEDTCRHTNTHKHTDTHIHIHTHSHTETQCLTRDLKHLLFAFAFEFPLFNVLFFHPFNHSLSHTHIHTHRHTEGGTA